MTINEAAEKFGKSSTRVRKLVKAGRIPGAEYREQDSDGNRLPVPYWHVPDDMKWPDDARSTGAQERTPTRAPARPTAKPPARRRAAAR